MTKFKRLIAVLVCAAMVCTVLPCVAGAEEEEKVNVSDSARLVASGTYSGTCGNNLTWTLEDGVLTIKGTGAMTNLSYYGNVSWYKYQGSITSVVIKDGVTSIGGSAFYNCSKLTNVYITDLAAWCNIDFGDNAANPLCYATNLYLNGELVKDVTIPNGVTEIGCLAFPDYKRLKSVIIPEIKTASLIQFNDSSHREPLINFNQNPLFH